MIHIFKPTAKKIENWAWWNEAFSNEELDWLQNKARNALITATVGGALPVATMATTENINYNTRRSYVDWLQKTEESAWVFERLEDVVNKLNLDYFNFDISGFGEPIQLTNYKDADSGMYGWHQDYNANVSRKLSVVLQLSTPSEYEGGTLQIMSDNICDIKKQRGLLVCFPSYMPHQVTPISEGTRQSLVAWISGPKFK
jgi:PKHD-type hydroxylase